MAEECVTSLRMDAGRCPDDPELAFLVRELSSKGADFRRRWPDCRGRAQNHVRAQNRVRAQNHGRKEPVHPTVGELRLDCQVMDVRGTADQTLARPHGRTRFPLGAGTDVPVPLGGFRAVHGAALTANAAVRRRR